jgi:hypothetical protein
MTQALYAHMNNKTKQNKTNKQTKNRIKKKKRKEGSW